MRPIVLVDRGDHWSVIMDYSGSPRHAAMSAEEWATEFEDEAYAPMKESHPGAVAVAIPFGAGDWKKDWSGPYVKSLPKLHLSSDGTADFDSVPSVDSTDKHLILIQAMDGGQRIHSSAGLRVMVTAPVEVSSLAPALENGKATIVVGPCSGNCDLVVKVADPDGRLISGSLKIRFKGVRPTAEQSAPSSFNWFRRKSS